MPRKFGFRNDYIIEGEITKIIVVNRKGKRFVILIDTEDLPRLIELDLSWHVRYDKCTNEYYARAIKYHPQTEDRTYYEETILLQRFIMNVTNNVVVDHHNHNRLDNRKENLFITEHTNNSSHRKGANSNNKTGVRNVHLVNRYGGKQLDLVQIMRKGERFCWEFGLDEFEDACLFAKQKREELFGEYAGNS